MKCFTHNATEAVAVCAYCGRALCPECTRSSNASRLACSSKCADALWRGERALELILEQSVRSAQASAFYCYLCAALSAGAAIVAWFMLPSPFLILFTAGCAVVLLLSGVWYGRAAHKSGFKTAETRPPGLTSDRITIPREIQTGGKIL
jgi:hypothetical protein